MTVSERAHHRGLPSFPKRRDDDDDDGPSGVSGHATVRYLI